MTRWARGGRAVRAFAVAATVTAGIGCRGQGLLPGPLPVRAGEPALDRETTKEVTAKRPGAIVARDGTWCAVADEAAQAIPIGRMWRCRWRRSA